MFQNSGNDFCVLVRFHIAKSMEPAPNAGFQIIETLNGRRFGKRIKFCVMSKLYISDHFHGKDVTHQIQVQGFAWPSKEEPKMTAFNATG